jgi:hypothetical protein
VKDFEFARTPVELGNELEKLLGGGDSAVAHHQERLAFLRTNLARITVELRLEGSYQDWQVHGLVVTSADLMAAHFPLVGESNKRLKIISYEALSAIDPRLLTTRTGVNRSTRTDRRRKRRKR